MTKAALKPPPAENLYETDFYLWTQAQAELLRERRFDALDLENPIDEVAGVGASERRELRNRLTVLITHLLQWKDQPGARSSGWQGTIDEQRDRLDQVSTTSPSLHRHPSEAFSARFKSAPESIETDRHRLHALPDDCAVHRRAGARSGLPAQGARPLGPVLTR